MRMKVLIFENDFHFVYDKCTFLNIIFYPTSKVFTLVPYYQNTTYIGKYFNGVLIDRKNVYLSQII